MNTGIICEFNPFHKGHKYLIDNIRKCSDNIICVMSGNFVQRGEFAVYDKFERAKAALDGGADLVIELPSDYSTMSAQGFAKAGVYLLESTGVCDSIAFGAECDNADELLKIAKEIQQKDAEIKKELETGVSYPAARRKVVNSPLLDTPNNILAIEYLTYTKLKPIAIKRIGLGHDSEDEEYSASEIRKKLNPDSISSMENCEKAILYKLRTMSAEDFLKIEDVSEGLENRIVDAAAKAKTLNELYELIKTKRYTMSRIRRIVLRAYLDIYNDSKTPSYLRVLAFNKKGRELLGEIKKTSSLPIITSLSDAKAHSDIILSDYLTECKRTDIYNLGFAEPRESGTEQKQKVIIKE